MRPVPGKNRSNRSTGRVRNAAPTEPVPRRRISPDDNTRIWLFLLHAYPVLCYAILDFNRTAATGEDSMNYLELGRLALMLDQQQVRQRLPGLAGITTLG